MVLEIKYSPALISSDLLKLKIGSFAFPQYDILSTTQCFADLNVKRAEDRANRTIATLKEKNHQRMEDANLKDTVKIKTKIGRIHEGKLIEENPSYKHNFGDTVKELIDINVSLREELAGLGEFEE